MPTSPERQLKPKPIKPADENRAGVQMDGSRFSDTAFDTYDATDYSENPDLETINPADQAHKLLDELQIAIAEKLRTLNGHRQKLEDDHSFIEDARKEIHQWTSSIRRIVNKVMEALERNTNNQNEYENRIAEVSQTIEDLSGIQEQAERLKEQIIIAGADHVAEHLLPEIQFLYTDAFDAHELGFDQPSQQFFIEGDNLSSIEVGEIVREQLYENIKEKGYADVWDDSIETVVDQEDTNLLEVVDALWSIEVGENIDPPVEITIKNRQYILTKKLGQGGVGVVFAARRFPNEKEIADGQGPRDVVIKTTKPFNNRKIYEARNFRVKTNYIEISALYELTRRPFRKILAEQEQVVADESEKNVRYGKVQLPEDLSSLPVATMFESTLIKAPTREQQRAQELADTETESLRVKEKALSTQLREPLKLESFIRNRINTLKTKISTLESADIPDNNEIAELQSELAEMNESLVKWQADYEAGTKKLQSLRNEIRAISNRVHETMGDNRVLFLVEELVVGKNIFEKFSDPENPISFTDTIKIIDQLLQAVNYTHDNGVYNKDLKPQNVMITDDGTLKIIDFGIAFIKRQADRQIKFKQPIGYQKSNKPTYAIPGSESIIGTQRYMSVWEKDFSSTNPIKARLDDIETKYADNPDVMHKAKVQAQEDYARSRDYFAVGKLMIALARTHLKNWGALSPNEKSEYYVLTYLANTLITESSRFPTEGLPYTPLSTIIDMFQRRHDPEIQSHAMSVSSMNLEVMARQCQNAKTLNELPDLSTLQPLQIKEPEAELQPQQNAETLSTQQADSEVLNEIKNLATNIDEIVDNEASNTNYDDQPGA